LTQTEGSEKQVGAVWPVDHKNPWGREREAGTMVVIQADSPGGGGKRKQEQGGKAGEKKVPVIERRAVVPTGIGRTRGGIRGGRNPVGGRKR